MPLDAIDEIVGAAIGRMTLAELRDLARGIAPPVLADRGLAAAVEALASRSVGQVTVQVDLDRRLAPVVEGAAYFVVCEALANAAGFVIENARAYGLSERRRQWLDILPEYVRWLRRDWIGRG